MACFSQATVQLAHPGLGTLTVVCTLPVAPSSPMRPCLQLGALGLATVLFQFAIGFFAALIFATTPRVAAHSDDKRMVSASPALCLRSTTNTVCVCACVCVATAPSGDCEQAIFYCRAPPPVSPFPSPSASVCRHPGPPATACGWPCWRAPSCRQLCTPKRPTSSHVRALRMHMVAASGRSRTRSRPARHMLGICASVPTPMRCCC